MVINGKGRNKVHTRCVLLFLLLRRASQRRDDIFKRFYPSTFNPLTGQRGLTPHLYQPDPRDTRTPYTRIALCHGTQATDANPLSLSSSRFRANDSLRLRRITFEITFADIKSHKARDYFEEMLKFRFFIIARESKVNADKTMYRASVSTFSPDYSGYSKLNFQGRKPPVKTRYLARGRKRRYLSGFKLQKGSAVGFPREIPPSQEYSASLDKFNRNVSLTYTGISVKELRYYPFDRVFPDGGEKSTSGGRLVPVERPPLMSMTGYYPHAAQDFHIAGNVVLHEIGRIIANLPLNIVDHHTVNINVRCVSILRLFSIKRD
ncbi:hypothetical protein ALC53_05856 [Atta colombica]|uniref:Uncharacterized protein n=1 Tax=Atta colombica TaxID=520822 RepID=A0A151I379_9HYME|nr:hypothetical protein ALC53_05856 [Atta colombica]